MSSNSRYHTLADELAAAITSGRMPAGASLPSLRDCAAQHGFSLNTVIAAYRLLEDRGLIAARPQSGFYVCDHLPAPQASLRKAPAGVGKGAQKGATDDVMTLVLNAQQRADYVDLALACPQGEKFYPGARLAKMTASVLRRGAAVSKYALPPGSQCLREQVALRSARLGMTLAADDIVVTHGAMEALHLALRAATRAGDSVGIEAPSYFNLYPLLDSLGLNAIEIPTHPQRGLDLDAVESLLREKRLAAIFVMPTIHNPLGYTMPVEAKQRLARLVNEYRIPLIEDALYAELQFAEPLQPTVKAFDSGGWVLICSSFSKTLAPDYRVGWLDAGRFGDAVRRLKFGSSIAESMLLSETIGRFLESGGYEHHLRMLRRLYYEQVAAVRGLVARHFPPGTKATQPEGGFLLWIELPASIDSLALFHAALAEKIVIIPGKLYSEGARYRHCLRLSCCQELDERVVRTIERLGQLATALFDTAPPTRQRGAAAQAGAEQLTGT
jgi:DNA-binding transcriptional MocR family regulator